MSALKLSTDTGLRAKAVPLKPVTRELAVKKRMGIIAIMYPAKIFHRFHNLRDAFVMLVVMPQGKDYCEARRHFHCVALNEILTMKHDKNQGNYCLCGGFLSS